MARAHACVFWMYVLVRMHAHAHTRTVHVKYETHGTKHRIFWKKWFKSKPSQYAASLSISTRNIVLYSVARCMCDDLLCNRPPPKQNMTTKQGGSPSKMPRIGEAGRMAPLGYGGGGGAVDDEDVRSRDLVGDAAVALAEVGDSFLVLDRIFWTPRWCMWKSCVCFKNRFGRRSLIFVAKQACSQCFMIA